MDMKLELSELALFLIGVLLSLLLLMLLFLPFITRFSLPRHARILGLDAEAVVAALRAQLPRADLVIVQVDRLDAPEGAVELAVRRPPNIFRLRVRPAGDGAWLDIAQDGLAPEDLDAMTVLTGTAVGYTSVKVHRLLTQAGATVRWHGTPDGAGPGASRPVRGVRRLFVQVSPWH